ncbi:hypothetical protein [Sphingomonas nostoxanthinifaciens]|nr:hypothetical protein [Sphingomonas nostoxanthinifaciens]UAK26806.1 hypothetical protein K8P63_13210 [Sphingomonas nostoxanthinifaciens]
MTYAHTIALPETGMIMPPRLAGHCRIEPIGRRCNKLVPDGSAGEMG